MAEDLDIKTDNSASIWREIQDQLDWHRVVLLKRIPDQVPCRSGVTNKAEKPSRRLGCQHWAINATTLVNPQAAAVRLQRLKEILPRLAQMKEGFETQEFFDLFSEYIDLTHCSRLPPRGSQSHRDLATAKFGDWWREHVAKSPQQVVVTEIQAPVSPDTSDGEVRAKISAAAAAAEAVQLRSPPPTDDGVDSDAASEDNSVEDTDAMEQDGEQKDNMGLYSDVTVVHIQENLQQEQTQSHVEPFDTYEAPEACLAPVPDSNIDNINGTTSDTAVNVTEELFVANIEAPTPIEESTQPAEPYLNPEPSIHAPSTRSRASTIFSELPGQENTISTCPDFDNAELGSEALQLEPCAKSNANEAAPVPAQASEEATGNPMTDKQQAAVGVTDLSSSQKGLEYEDDISVPDVFHVEETEGPRVDADQQPAMKVSKVLIPHHEADQQPEKPAINLLIEQQAYEQQADEQQADEQLHGDAAHTDELKANEVQADITRQLEQEADNRLSIRSSQLHPPAPVIWNDQQGVPATTTAAEDQDDRFGSSYPAPNTANSAASQTSLVVREFTTQEYAFPQSSHDDSTRYKADFKDPVVERQAQNSEREGDVPQAATPTPHQHNTRSSVSRKPVPVPAADRNIEAKPEAQAAVNQKESGLAKPSTSFHGRLSNVFSDVENRVQKGVQVLKKVIK